MSALTIERPQYDTEDTPLPLDDRCDHVEHRRFGVWTCIMDRHEGDYHLMINESAHTR